MHYYLFLSDLDNGVTGTIPHNDEGRELWPIFNPRPWDADHGTSRVPHYAEEPNITNAEQLSDYIFIGGLCLLLSLKVKMILEGLCLGEEIGFLPTRIVTRKGKHIADYFMLYSRTRTPVVDTEKSDIDYGPVKEFPPLAMHSWVLRAEQLPDSDVFRSEISWMVTQRVKDQFESHGVKGVFLKPIWSHEEGSVKEGWDTPWSCREF